MLAAVAANAATDSGASGEKRSCDDILNLKYCKSMQIHSGSIPCITGK